MATFIIGLVILFGGAALYGTLCEKVFGPDDRATPAYAKQDGVDYVPMRCWKNSLINLLNIAGTGPILGPIQGILFGPIAFITIPIGNIIGGAMHDYFCGMICLRDGGTQMSEMIRKYTNKGIFTVYNIFVRNDPQVHQQGHFHRVQHLCVRASSAGGRRVRVHPRRHCRHSGVRLLRQGGRPHHLDHLPIFGAILLFSAVGVFVGIFVLDFPLLNIWDEWVAPLAFTTAADGTQVAFSYQDYFTNGHFIPVFFVTVACGILSGFHSTQTAIISRTVKSEKQGRMTFYNMMVLEGFIAMVWAAGAMGVYNLGEQAASAGLATATIGVVCKHILGPVGGIIALLGVIVLPVTSGDTALRALRLTLSESLHIDQSTNAKRLSLAAPVFALVAAIIVWAKMDTAGFNTLWRYFAWSNQTLSLFAFVCISIWLFESGKSKFVWMPLIPGAFYTFICSTFIANATIGFNLPWAVAYPIGAVLTVAYVVAIVTYGKKRAARAALNH